MEEASLSSRRKFRREREREKGERIGAGDMERDSLSSSFSLFPFSLFL